MIVVEFKKRHSTEIAFEVEIGDEYASRGLPKQRGVAIVKALSEKKDLRDADLSHCDLRSSNLKDSNLRGCDLSYCNLSYCELTFSDLGNCNLSYSDISHSRLGYCNLKGSNLRDANFFSTILEGSKLSVLLTDMWTAYIQPEHIRIGCQCHTASEWLAFEDDEIADMTCGALEWWKKWKPVIKAAHESILGGEPA